MKIKFKEETWYSRMAFLIFFLGVYPVIIYLLGMNHAALISETYNLEKVVVTKLGE